MAITIIAAAVGLAYIDPGQRALLAGALTLGVGSAIGYLFSQHATTTAVHSTTNGMSTMAALISAGNPGPTGGTGPVGTTGAVGPPGPAGPPAVAALIDVNDLHAPTGSPGG